MIFKQIKQHPSEYLSLLLVLIATVILFFSFSFDHRLQRRVIYAACTLYFAWSLFHHYRRGDLEVSIIIEYLIFALLAAVVITSTLL